MEYLAEVLYFLGLEFQGSEQTFSALSIKALTTALLAKTGWLELKSKYLSVWGGLSVDCYHYVFSLRFREGVQEGNASLCVWLFYGEFDMGGQLSLDIVA